jgi:heat-inducible transcriptional repressor
VQGYGLGISPATIRNEMAVLEELGYLTHRHTSAGRVPTDLGYRFFVENMLGETELPASERHMIAHQFHQARLELDQWARLAAAVLAHTTRKAAVATAPRIAEPVFKHLELVSLRDSMVLLVLVLEGGTLKQRMLFLDEAVDQAALSGLSNLLNDHFAGLAAPRILTLMPTLPAIGQHVALVVSQIMTGVDQQSDEGIHRDGLAHILAEPEFAQRDQVHHMVHAIEGPALLEIITTVTGPLEVGGVQVLIGGEGRWEDLRELSLVLSRYGVAGGATGLLGVVGPLRMSYDRTIGAVQYVSQLMSDMVSDWYGGESSSGERPLTFDVPPA